MLIQEQYRVCYEAILAAGLSPATLAADPECIKRVVEAAANAVSCERASIGGDTYLLVSVPAADGLKAALAAIGKEPA